MVFDPSRQRLWVLWAADDQPSSVRPGFYDVASDSWQLTLVPPLPYQHDHGYLSQFLMPGNRSILVFGGPWPRIYEYDITTEQWSIWSKKPVSSGFGGHSDIYASGSAIIDMRTLVWIDHQHDWHQWDLGTRAYHKIEMHLPEARQRAFSTFIAI